MNRLTIGLMQIMPCGRLKENLKKGMAAGRQAKAAGNMHRQMKDAHHADDAAKDTCEMRFASFFDFWENGKKKKDKKAGISAAVVQKVRLFSDFTEPRAARGRSQERS